MQHQHFQLLQTHQNHSQVFTACEFGRFYEQVLDVERIVEEGIDDDGGIGRPLDFEEFLA